MKISAFLPLPLESSVFKSNRVWGDYRLSALFSSDWRRIGGKYVGKSTFRSGIYQNYSKENTFLLAFMWNFNWEMLSE